MWRDWVLPYLVAVVLMMAVVWLLCRWLGI